MLKNHLLSIYRNLKRNKGYAAINIIGLAIGFAAATLISVYVKSEFTYDEHYANHDRIYRLSANNFALSSIAHLNQVKEYSPLVEEVVNLMPNPSATIKTAAGKSLVIKDFFYTTEGYNTVFEQDYVLGNAETSLSVPNGLILTETMAKKLFGKANPVGQKVSVSTQIAQNDFQVTGVIKDLPSNVSLPFSALGRLPKDFQNTYQYSFSFTTGYSYLFTKENVTEEQLKMAVEEAMLPIDHSRYGEGKPMDEFKKTYQSGLLVMPLRDVHLNSNIQFESSEPGNANYLYVFLSIAVFVILLAAINYVNLSTAQASKRAKEIGIRSVLGSFRNQLISRFIAESVLIALTAVLIGFGLAEAALQLLQGGGFAHFDANITEFPQLVAVVFSVAVLTGFAAGIYPAFYLTNFKPSAVLKGDFNTGGKSKSFRNGLVIFQFAVSLSLAIFAVFIGQQLHFSMQKDLGFDKTNVLMIDNTKGQLGESAEAFRNELLKNAEIKEVGFSHYELTGLAFNVIIENGVDNPQSQRIQYKYTDTHYAETMGMELVAGRFLSDELDDAAMLVNETLAKNLGGDVLGRKFNAGVNGSNVEVVGVVKDFHYEDFRKAIGPVAFYYSPIHSLISVKFSGDIKQATEATATVFGQFTQEPFDYKLFEHSFDQLFDKEKQMGQVINLFTGLAVFVAILGLIGLVTYTLDQRVKEIGIRKVLGASVSQILGLLSKEMLALIGISFLVAIPLAFLAVSQWMNEFVYHINIGVAPFILVGGVAAILILTVVAARSLTTATANPVKSLRSE
ncbi:ABC transporter permease [Roseivirga pacifica]